MGFTYSMGKEEGGMQMVNLEAPEATQLFKQPEYGTEINYDQLQLTIGYVYNIQ